MTDNQWINLANNLMRYSGKVDNSIRKRFMKRVKSDSKTLQQAISLFGNSGIYDATEFDIVAFLASFNSDVRVTYSKKDFSQRDRDRAPVKYKDYKKTK